jgi:ATP-dependent RNA helicase SUPV3L1/SUV3
VQAAVRRRLRSELAPLVAELVQAPDASIALQPDGRLVWTHVRADGPATEFALGRMTSGPVTLEPKVSLARLDLLDAADREKVRVRLTRWRDAWVAALFAPLERPAAAKLGPAGRGLVHALRMGLGSVDREEVEDVVGALRPDDRALLAKLDVRIGTFTVFVQSLLRQEPLKTRAALWSLAHGRFPLLDPPADGRATYRLTGAGRDSARSIGFRVVGGLAVRVDLLEKVGAEVRAMARTPSPKSTEVLTSWLGCTPVEAIAVVRALGFQVRGQPEGPVQLRRAR